MIVEEDQIIYTVIYEPGTWHISVSTWKGMSVSMLDTTPASFQALETCRLHLAQDKAPGYTDVIVTPRTRLKTLASSSLGFLFLCALNLIVLATPGACYLAQRRDERKRASDGDAVGTWPNGTIFPPKTTTEFPIISLVANICLSFTLSIFHRLTSKIDPISRSLL